MRISTIKANLVEKVLLHILSHSDFSFSITEVLFDKKDQFYYIYFTDDKTDIQRSKGFKPQYLSPKIGEFIPSHLKCFAPRYSTVSFYDGVSGSRIEEGERFLAEKRTHILQDDPLLCLILKQNMV